MEKLNSRLLDDPEFEMGPFSCPVKTNKRRPITMATCHAGKNLREENGDGKPATAAKGRLRQFGLLLPALAFVNWKRKW